MTRWVSVKNRLPKIDRVVIVCWSSGYDGRPVYSWGARVQDDERWLWGIYGSNIDPRDDAARSGIEVDDDYPVTHWMPSPRPPLRPRGKPEQER